MTEKAAVKATSVEASNLEALRFGALSFDTLCAKSRVFRDNIRFLSQFRLSTVLHHIIDDIEREKQIMATIEDDETRLEADVATEATLITQVQGITAANTVEIAALNTEIADLKAKGTDTTRLEAGLTALETQNVNLGTLVPPAKPSAAA